MKPREPVPEMRWFIPAIVIGLVLWAILHAAGAYTFNQNPWRAVVVLASFGLFLAWWWWLLRSRRRRLET